MDNLFGFLPRLLPFFWRNFQRYAFFSQYAKITGKFGNEAIKLTNWVCFAEMLRKLGNCVQNHHFYSKILHFLQNFVASGGEIFLIRNFEAQFFWKRNPHLNALEPPLPGDFWSGPPKKLWLISEMLGGGIGHKGGGPKSHGQASLKNSKAAQEAYFETSKGPRKLWKILLFEKKSTFK